MYLLDKIYSTRGRMFGKGFFNKTEFFGLFEKQAMLAEKVSKELMESFAGRLDPSILARVKPLEHEADVVAHQCMELLHTTFITPFDRDQIHSLIGRLDDVIDSMDSVVDGILIYKIRHIKPELFEFGELIIKAVEVMQRGVRGLRLLGDADGMRQICAKIHQCEHEADIVLNAAMGRLFDEEADAKEIIKWKMIYENLEETTDRCADVADLLEEIVLENG